MPNRHQIQRDFNLKMKEWKKSLEAQTNNRNDGELTLFDEELYPEFNDDNYTRSYYKKSEDSELEK